MKKSAIAPVLFVVALLSFCPFVTAQQSKVEKADQLMEALRYQEAIGVYQKLYQKDNASLPAVLGLATAYRKSGKLEEAASWYGKALSLPTVDPAVYFTYGQVLLQVRNCASAQSAFNHFLRLKPDDERKSMLADVCAYQNQLLVESTQRIHLSLPGFNGPASELAPAFYQKGIVFAALRPAEGRKPADYDLFYTKVILSDQPAGVDLSYEPPQAFSDLLNNPFNEAIVAFSPDFSTIYFTHNQERPVSEKYPLRRLEILATHRDATGAWSAPEGLPFNSPGFSTAHPALSADGNRLFFTSDRPGGFGGKDLYYSERIGLNWSDPVNLGPQINTEGDELYPFVHPNGDLYFASNGQLGLGGLDIFRSEDLGGGAWSLPENMGAPINSVSDDFGFILEQAGNYGFLTSNRIGGAWEDDIYAFQYRYPVVQEQYAAKGSQADLHGTVYDKLTGLPIPFAQVKLVSTDCADTVRLAADESGYFVHQWEAACCYELSATKENYFNTPYEQLFCFSKQEQYPDLAIYLAPYRLEANQKMTQVEKHGEDHFQVGTPTAPEHNDRAIPYLLNVYYDLDRASVRAEAIPELSRLYWLMVFNPELQLEISSYTDSRGSAEYNRHLSQRRADAIVNWLVKKGVSRSRLIAKGYGEERLVNSCQDGVTCTENEHQNNRRTEFRVTDQKLGHTY